MTWIDDKGRIHRINPPSGPPVRPQEPQPQPVYQKRRIYCSDRSFIIAGIIAIAFGILGIHNFYIKYYKKGFIQLSATLVAIFLINQAPVLSLLVIFGMEIWGVIEGILLFSGKIYRDGKNYGFWRNWFIDDDTVIFEKPYNYPFKKDWIITSIALILLFIVIVTSL